MRLLPALILSVLALCAFLVLVPLDRPASAPESPLELTPRRGGTYLACLRDDPPTLDPALTIDTTSVSCVIQLFDSLVRCDQGHEIRPGIARSWKVSDDLRVYDFELDPKARFHAVSEGKPTANGGRAVTAEDVRWSFERVLSPATASPRGIIFHVIEGAEAFLAGKSPHVTGIEVLGKTGLRIRLKRPFAPFLATLSMPNASIVPKEDVLSRGRDFARFPVGTGPFRLARYERGKELVLEANDEYFLGRPYLDVLSFRIIALEGEMFGQFEEGKIFHCTVPDPEYARVKADPEYKGDITEVPQIGTYYFGFNLSIKPFDDKALRQALSYAIDKRSIVRYIRNDRVQVARGPLPPGIPGYSAGLQGYEFDLDRAEQLLDEAGYAKNSETGIRETLAPIEVHVDAGTSHMRVLRAIQANLADIGVRTIPRIRDWNEHLAMSEEGKLGFYRMGWVADYLDADNFLFINFHSSNQGKGNGCAYANPEVDRLLLEARRTIDPDARNRLYNQAETLVVDDAVWICIFYYRTCLVSQKFVQGLNLTPLGEHMLRFEKVWLSAPAPGKTGN